ncbi:hypothetical protein IWZ03DRAFT_378996 [Phyllosticta citriasiana]|uniref:Uncharacterized protein n=1 Tax=Phyllosticta citriasiana TaxID=595635 RepID=A0ABR1KL11_9PEZI
MPSVPSTTIGCPQSSSPAFFASATAAVAGLPACVSPPPYSSSSAHRLLPCPLPPTLTPRLANERTNEQTQDTDDDDDISSNSSKPPNGAKRSLRLKTTMCTSHERAAMRVGRVQERRLPQAGSGFKAKKVSSLAAPTHPRVRVCCDAGLCGQLLCVCVNDEERLRKQASETRKQKEKRRRSNDYDGRRTGRRRKYAQDEQTNKRHDEEKTRPTRHPRPHHTLSTPTTTTTPPPPHNMARLRSLF